MSAGRRSPTSSRACGTRSRARIDRQRHDEERGRGAISRPGSRRGTGSRGSALRRASAVGAAGVGGTAPACAAVRWASARATSPDATLPSARPRVRGESQPMTLPMSRARTRRWPRSPRRRGAGAASSGAARAGTRARIAISASSFAARSSRPPFRNASTDSRRVFTSRVDRGDDSSSEVAPVALFDGVDRVLGHAQDIATQRVTRPHRGGDVVLDPISKGHRMATSGGRASDGH